ncbi:amino acid carrier protein alsT [hydrothermal vent metagenome]|uniref:Amino acid carrier protein alsT n=1 Tax=hydrothermal vent metagenome TaxID=652676 RepID=A0A1W1BA79_9ZZZZ
MEIINEIVDFLSGVLWNYILVYMLIAGGLYFSYKIKFIQFRYIKHMIALLFNSGKRSGKEEKISSFQAFAISSASRVGTGNLAGVAMAIYLGGAGAVFWMWVLAIIGAASSMIENTLAQAYKVKNDDGTFRGGPAYYMEQGLGSKKMGMLFSILIIVSFGLVFNAVQAHTISNSFHKAFGVDVTIVGVGLIIASGLVIFGGLKRIANVAQVIFPFMALGYLFVALFVTLVNYDQIPAMFGDIFAQAFGIEQAGSGALGFMIMQGIKRGLFSNEAGMGSTPNAGATADVSHPVKQGFIQTLGVFVDTLVICSTTAFLVLSTNAIGQSDLNGIQLTQYAVSTVLGHSGNVFIAVMILLFSFTSIIGNYYYGESNIEFMTENKLILNIFRGSVLAMIMFGSLAHIDVVWNLADVFMGFMALLNTYAIFKLFKIANALIEDYITQLKAGKDPVFDKDKVPQLKNVECW